MPPKKSVYGSASASKSSKGKATGAYSKAQITSELAILKQQYGTNYINNKLKDYKFASDAQMTAFIKKMKKKALPRSNVDIQGDLDMERERLGSGVVNEMLGTGFLDPMEMEDILAKLRKMKSTKKVEVRREERASYDTIHDNLVKVAENSPSEDMRSVAKTVEEELSIAQIERAKIDKVNKELVEGIKSFKNMMTFRGEFDTSRNIPLKIDADHIGGILARLSASFTELGGEKLNLAEIPFDSILGALTASFESAKKVVEIANTYSSDLSAAVQSKIASEQGRAVADAAFTELENYIYGNMPRSIMESNKDYNSRKFELEKILSQKQNDFQRNVELLSVANSRIADLSTQLDNAHSQLNGGSADYNKLAADYKKIQDGVAILNNELSYLRAARTSFGNLCDKFHTTFDKLAPQIEMTLVDLETRRNAAQTELVENEGKHKEEITKLNDTINDLENKVEELEEHLRVAFDNHEQIVQEHVDKYDTFKNKTDIRIAKLKQTIADLKQQRTSAQNELKKAKEQLEGITKQLELKSNEIETLNNNIESLKKAKNDADAATTKANELVATYAASNKELSKKLTDETEKVIKANALLESQAVDFNKREQAAAEQHQKDIEKLQAQLDSVAAKYDMALKVLKSNKNEIGTLTEEKAKLLQQLEEAEHRVGDLATKAASADKVRQSLDTAADVIAQQQESIQGMKFLWDGLIHPKAEFKGVSQIIGSQGEIERLRNLARRYEIAYNKKKQELLDLEARFKGRGEVLARVQEELQSLRNQSNQQNQGLNPEARAHLHLVAEAANPNGQIAKITEAAQSLMEASKIIIPGDVASEPPAKAARLVIPSGSGGAGGGDDGFSFLGAISDLFGGFFRGGQAAAGGMPGGDPDVDMYDEGFLGPEDRAIETIRVKAWRTLGYRSEVSTAKKAKRDNRSSFTSSRFVGGFIVGHAPDWNLQPNQLIFDFWNNYYNTSKPFDL